jgi:RNA polymerase sigma-70 factor (ECF subfamily)
VLHDKDKRRLFDEVFRPHLAAAYRLARWLTGNADDAEDVVQEASLRAFRGIEGFSGVNARAWVLTVVRNTAYSWLLKNRRPGVVFTEDLAGAEQDRLEGQADGASVATPESLLIDKATAEAVRNAVAALPMPFREVIVLREMHDLNYRDIAEVTRVPIGTVMSRLARARALLRTALEKGVS